MYYPIKMLVNGLKTGSTILLLACVLVWLTEPFKNQIRPVTASAQTSAPDSSPAPSSSAGKQYACLPKNVRADDPISRGRGPKGKTVTVSDTLSEIKARCQKGKLVDAKGREIRFFRASCWGNPPEDYLEIRARESRELAKLKSQYTVIEFHCDPRIP
jgi:hypothetical protein